MAETRKVRYLTLEIDDETQLRRLLAGVERVLRHGRLVIGPEVQELERRVAVRCGRKYDVGVSSGSTALLLGLKSVGIGPGDEVITTPLSWIATANAIVVAGGDSGLCRHRRRPEPRSGERAGAGDTADQDHLARPHGRVAEHRGRV